METNRLTLLMQMLESQPNDAFLLYAIAVEHEAQQNKDLAEHHFRLLLKNQPAYLPTYYRYTEFLFNQSRLEEAAQIAEKGILLANQQKEAKTLRELQSLKGMIEMEMD